MNNRLRQNSGMTVQDLIDELEQLDREAPVFFTCDYGDHCHTTQALPVREVGVKQSTEFDTDSGYSNSGIALKRVYDDDPVDLEMDKREDTDDETFDVVTLG